MCWKKYSSIENSYRTKFVDKIKDFGYHTKEWCVTEKVDGQNFSFIISENNIEMAKRSTTININELKNFPGMKDYFNDNIENFKKVFNILKKEDDSIESVIIYGENYGGKYIHSDIPNNNAAKKVQGRVQYIPYNSFIAYDLAIVTCEGFRYVNYDYATEVFIHANIDYIPVIFRGSLDDCLEYPNIFNTRIPLLFNLPEIENNVCEGIVIKPVEPFFFPSGERVIIKNKNEKFSEKMIPKVKIVSEDSEEVSIVKEHLSEFIVENRLRNVLSHIGVIKDKDFGLLMKEMSYDVINDYTKEYEEEHSSLSKENQKIISKWLNKEISNLIRPNFLNIVDNNF